MSPLSITIASGPFYPTPPAPTGAVQRIWTDLADQFARAGHRVTIVACRHEGQAAEEDRPAGSNSVRILRCTSLRQGRSIYRDILKDSWYSLRALPLLPRADILVTHAFWLPALAQFRQGGLGRLVIHVARVPKGQLRLYKRAACFDTPSEAIRDEIVKEAPWAASRVRVTPYPIDTATFTPPPGRELRNGSRTLLYTGRIHPEKGIHVLVEAFSRLRREFPDLRLRLIGASKVNEGGGGPDYVRTLAAGAEPNTVFIDDPIYDRAGLAAALQAGDLYCYPSLAEKGETFGVAPLEAMATGLAPVVSDLACFRQFMIDGQTGFFFQHRSADPAGALADTLRPMLKDLTLARTLGAAAAARAREFSLAAIADMHLANFADLVAGRASNAGAGGA